MEKNMQAAFFFFFLNENKPKQFKGLWVFHKTVYNSFWIHHFVAPLMGSMVIEAFAYLKILIIAALKRNLKECTCTWNVQMK